MCLPVEGPADELDKLVEMGGDPCVFTRLRGSYAGFGRAYAALADYAKEKGLAFAGPPQEVYVRGPLLGFLTFIPTMITDINSPIGRGKASTALHSDVLT
jgi:hypothetical protein